MALRGTPPTMALRLSAPSDALRLAVSGRHVVVVSSGDPGVFAMASALFEAIEIGDKNWRNLDIRVLPGITAMLAAAARAGAHLAMIFAPSICRTISNLGRWSSAG